MRRLNLEKFIERAKKIHGNKYDYTKSIYVSYETKLNIKCHIHGEFNQKARKHLEGNGCKKCVSDKLFLTKEIFITRANKIHQNKYDYSLTEYNGINNIINIICPFHGSFFQKPIYHLRKHGCGLCYNEKKILYNSDMRKSTKSFIEESICVHQDRYDYSLVNYTGAFKKVIIVCKIHGEFLQQPKLHIHHQQGCPKCCHVVSKPEIAWLDSLNIPKENRNKNKTINGRKFKFDALVGNIVYEFNGDYFHGNPQIFDQNKINPTVKKTYGELYQKTLDKEKFLIDAGYQVMTMWENNWNKENKQ